MSRCVRAVLSLAIALTLVALTAGGASAVGLHVSDLGVAATIDTLRPDVAESLVVDQTQLTDLALLALTFGVLALLPHRRVLATEASRESLSIK